MLIFGEATTQTKRLSDWQYIVNATPRELAALLDGETSRTSVAIHIFVKAVREYARARAADAPSNVLKHYGEALVSRYYDIPPGAASLLLAQVVNDLGATRYIYQCEHCGHIGKATRSTKRFCGDECRALAHYRAKRAEALR